MPKLVSKAFAAVALMHLAGSIAAEPPAVIRFADLDGIRDWYADNPNELFVENNRLDWYRATFQAPCESLPSALNIEFVTQGNGDLDEFSSIVVEGERCRFATFEHADSPWAGARGPRGRGHIDVRR